MSGATLPAEIRGIVLEVSVAGRTFRQEVRDEVSNLLNLTHEFAWDGLDGYGRRVQGQQPVTVALGYVYPGSYQQTERFGYSGNGVPITARW
jgi:hypothetical protein